MDQLEPSTLQVAGGFLMLAGVFVLREFVSGALKKAGEEFWTWARHRLPGGQAAESTVLDTARTGERAGAGRRRGEPVDPGANNDESLCLLARGRGKADAAATWPYARRCDAPPQPPRKSACAGDGR